MIAMATGGQVTTTQDRGRALEQQIGAFLTQHGYAVRCNVMVEGRSGARHELDVVGDKSDGLTTFRLVVECKAWKAPIDKDVIYKLAGVLADLGAAKGIIAALSGWTAQAAQVAGQANIELWGPEELTARLGQVPVNDVRFAAAQVQALGSPFATDGVAARQLVERIARGTLGIGREEVIWFGPIWLPVWVLQLGITRVQGFRQVPRVTRSWNRYEALAGTYLDKSEQPPNLVPIDVGRAHVRPRLTDAKIRDGLLARVERYRSVTTDAAKQRHAASLTQLGVQLPLRSLASETSQLTYSPLWCAFLRKGSQERLVAIGGVSGKERPALSGVLTTNSQWVRDSLSA
jgi:hypothetical protein